MAVRTYKAARAFARPMAMAGDRVGAAKLLSNLLWHVEAREGGFIGLTDEQLEDKCASDGCLSYAAATAAQHAPAPWPTAEVIAFPVAAVDQQAGAARGML